MIKDTDKSSPMFKCNFIVNAYAGVNSLNLSYLFSTIFTVFIARGRVMKTITAQMAKNL